MFCRQLLMEADDLQITYLAEIIPKNFCIKAQKRFFFHQLPLKRSYIYVLWFHGFYISAQKDSFAMSLLHFDDTLA